jgi:hypothetical protein
VLTLDGGLIADFTTFLDPELLPRFGLVEPAGSLSGYVKEAGGARRSDGRAPPQPLRDRAER